MWARIIEKDLLLIRKLLNILKSVDLRIALPSERCTGYFSQCIASAWFMVGKAGFEPATSTSRTLRASQLRYFPIKRINIQKCPDSLKIHLEKVRASR